MVSGGQPTNPLWTSQVGNEEFRAALVQAVEQAGLAAPAPDHSSYRLDADLVGLAQPMFGFDLTVTSTVNYELTPVRAGEPYRTTVSRSYAAAMGDAFLATERLRLANEGSIRANISGLLDELNTHFDKHTSQE